MIRFGRIHILSPEFVQKLKTPENATDSRTFMQRLETALQDQPAAAENPWHHFVLWDGRKAILTNTDTQDVTRFEQYRHAHWNRVAGGPGEKQLIDTFITENSEQKIYFDA